MNSSILVIEKSVPIVRQTSKDEDDIKEDNTKEKSKIKNPRKRKMENHLKV